MPHPHRIITAAVLIVAHLMLFGVGTIALASLARAESQPLASDQAFRAVVKIYSYAPNVNYFLARQSFGSGVIIDDQGTILTNYHVIAGQGGIAGQSSAAGQNTVAGQNTGVTSSVDLSTASSTDPLAETAYQICLTIAVEKSPSCAYVADVVAFNKKNDIALLRIVPPSNIGTMTFPHLDLERSDAVNIGDAVTALGYPNIGGQTITISSGKIIGKEAISGQSWLKTDAVFSLGSSGGALLNAQGAIIGVTTAISSDTSSLGYVIDGAPLKTWIAKNAASKAKTHSAYYERLARLTAEQQALEASRDATIHASVDAMRFSVTRPAGWEISHKNEGYYNFDDHEDDEGGGVSLTFSHSPYALGKQALISYLKIDRPLLDIKTVASVKIKGTPAFSISAIDGDGSLMQSYFIMPEGYIISVRYSNGTGDKDRAAVQTLINSITITAAAPKRAPLKEANHSLFSFNIAKSKGWTMLPLHMADHPLEMYNAKHPYAVAKVTIISLDDWPDAKNTSNKALLEKMKQLIAATSKQSIQNGAMVENELIASSADYKVKNHSFVYTELREKKSQEVIDYESKYTIRRGNTLLQFSLVVFHKDEKVFAAADRAFRTMLQSSLKVK